MKLNNTIYLIIIGVICTVTPLHNMYGQGSRYTGTYTKSGPVSYSNRSNFVIEGLEINNASGNAITVSNCENVTIRYNRVTNSDLMPAIYVFSSRNVTIIDNTLENVQSGLVASTSQGVKFEYNDVLNVLGSLRGGSKIGVMAQFISVSGAGNSISYNANENHSGKSSTEDIINVFNSNGTAQSPIVIRGNWIRGGGPSTSGGGINIGDFGGSYQVIENNILVNPGQYGAAASGGNNMTIRNNKVYQKRDIFTNVGLIACNWTEDMGRSYNITVENNTVNYTHRDGYSNSWWLNQTMDPIAGRSTNVTDTRMTASILPDQILGRASSSGATSPNEPDDQMPGGSQTNPDQDGGDLQPENPVNEDQEPDIPINLPYINNHPSITIYLDQFNRPCVNVVNRKSSATLIAADSNGNIIYQTKLNRYHTVLPTASVPGTYYVYVKNGDKEHLKQLQIR